MSAPKTIYLKPEQAAEQYKRATDGCDLEYRLVEACEWKGDAELWAGCTDFTIGTFKRGDFCPYCGNKIKVISDE